MKDSIGDQLLILDMENQEANNESKIIEKIQAYIIDIQNQIAE